jgi:hypothetical protein
LATKPATKNNAAAAVADAAESAGEAKGTRRTIPGNMPYTATHKRLGDALKALIDAERPPKFNEDFLGTVLKIRGGSGRPIPPILKRVGLLNPDNSPTELYSKFKSDSSRPGAALQALKNGFSEIFKRSEYAHRESDEKVRDIIVEITGLTKSDGIVTSILGTFNTFREYAKGVSAAAEKEHQEVPEQRQPGYKEHDRVPQDATAKFNLVNTINVVLPETTDVQVYNAIFRSIRENLM